MRIFKNQSVILEYEADTVVVDQKKGLTAKWPS